MEEEKLQASNAANQEGAMQIQLVRAQLDAKEELLHNLSTELSVSQDEVKNLQRVLATAKAQVGVTSGSLKAVNLRLKVGTDLFRKQTEALTGKVEEQKKALESARAELGAAKAKVETDESILKMADEKLGLAKGEVIGLKVKRRLLEAKLKKSDANTTAAHRALSAMHAQLAENRAELQQARSQAQSLAAKKNELEMQVDDILKFKFPQVLKVAEILNTTRAALQKENAKVEELSTKYANVRAELEALTKDKRTQVVQTSEDVKTLRRREQLGLRVKALFDELKQEASRKASAHRSAAALRVRGL